MRKGAMVKKRHQIRVNWQAARSEEKDSRVAAEKKSARRGRSDEMIWMPPFRQARHACFGK